MGGKTGGKGGSIELPTASVADNILLPAHGDFE